MLSASLPPTIPGVHSSPTHRRGLTWDGSQAVVAMTSSPSRKITAVSVQGSTTPTAKTPTADAMAPLQAGTPKAAQAVFPFLLRTTTANASLPSVNGRTVTVMSPTSAGTPLAATPTSFMTSPKVAGAFANAMLALPDKGIDVPEDEQSTPPLPATVSLPAGARCWTQFERDLFLLTNGVYHPEEQARRRRLPLTAATAVGGGTGASSEVVGRVSVVTPTMSSRQHFHEQLWACFKAQTWQDKELVVLETYEDEPSSFLHEIAKTDKRLVLCSFQRKKGEDFNVGMKRNMTLHLASGEFIVNFDDDDIYASTYIQKMVGEMKTRRLEGITLSAWYNYFVHSGTVGYTDPLKVWEVPIEELEQSELDEVLYGYGFSYVHRRRPSLALPYPSVCFAEDAPFFLGLRRHFGDDKIALKRDLEGLCMHLVHRANSAGHMPTAREVSAREIDSLDVTPLFKKYLETRTTTLMQRYQEVVNQANLFVESFVGLWAPRGVGEEPSAQRIPAQAVVAPALSHRRVRSV